jgi:hypothetical protein
MKFTGLKLPAHVNVGGREYYATVEAVSADGGSLRVRSDEWTKCVLGLGIQVSIDVLLVGAVQAAPLKGAICAIDGDVIEIVQTDELKVWKDYVASLPDLIANRFVEGQIN